VSVDILTARLEAVALTANTIPTPLARRVHDSARLLQHRITPAIDVIASELAAYAWPSLTPLNGAPAGRSSDNTSRPERATLKRLGDTRPGPATDRDTLDRYTRTALTAINTAADHHTQAQHIHTHPGPSPWATIAAALAELDLADDWTYGAYRALKHCHDACTRNMPARDPRQQWRCRGTGDELGARCENVADYRIYPDGTIDSMDGRCRTCRLAVEEREENERRAREAARQRRWRHRRSA